MRPSRNNLIIQTAKKSATEYCKRNGLRAEKLDSQIVHSINNKVIFAQPVKKTGTLGLKADKSTMPKPTLIVEKTARGYVVSATNNTATYLK